MDTHVVHVTYRPKRSAELAHEHPHGDPGLKAQKDKKVILTMSAKSKEHALNRAGAYMSKRNYDVVDIKHHSSTKRDIMNLTSVREKFERIEPTFGPNPNKPKQTKAQAIVARNSVNRDHEPTMDGKPHPSYTITRGEKGRYQRHDIPPAPKLGGVEKNPAPRHTLVINKDQSIHYHDPDGNKHVLFPSMRHMSSVHGSVLDSVRYLKHQDPHADVHVVDKIGGYKKFHDETKASSAKQDKLNAAASAAKMTPSQQKKHSLSKAAQIYPHRFNGFPNHTISETMDHDLVVVKNGNSYDSYVDQMKTIFKEHAEMVAESKYAPKKLKDIVSKPSRRWNEYKGNTKDEQDIVQKYEDSTVKHPDRNGNGDEVFNGTKVIHNGKPVEPGDDEVRYGEWNGDVKNIGESCKVGDSVVYGIRTADGIQKKRAKVIKVEGTKIHLNSTAILDHSDEVKHHDDISTHHDFVKEELNLVLPSQLNEAVRPLTGKWGSEKINPRHLDYHWATKHVAQPGDHISMHGEDAHIHSTDGMGNRVVHVIEGGAKHITEMPKGSYEKPAGRTDAHAGKHTVVRTTHSYGVDKKVDFVAAKKAKGNFGGHHYTGDETQAKEFKTKAHAENHANMMNRFHAEYGDQGHPKHFSAYPKRDSKQVKSSQKAFEAAKANHAEVLKKHGYNHTAKEVHDSYHEMQSKRHPAFYGTK